MRLRVLEGQNFSCHSCTDCCRHWHVELLREEVEAIPALSWPKDDPLAGAAVLRRFGGSTYLAHKPSGACILLNEANGRCRIHERFGASRKPLGCRLFPFHVTPTFEGEVSVSVRYDCPSVRRNLGEPLSAQRREIERCAKALRLTGGAGVPGGSAGAAGFDDLTRCLLSRQQIEAVVDFVVALSPGFTTDDQRALFLGYLCDWLHDQPVDGMDRACLGAAFATLKEQVEAAAAGPVRQPGGASRLAFRALLALHLRRDEDVLDGRATRLGRIVGTARLAAGGGGLPALGLTHPPGSTRRANLFRGHELADPQAMALFWRMLRGKLESLQFMGTGHGGRNFLAGLRALALLYPLTLAAAKLRAAGRGASALDAADVDFAVAAIEHPFGRLAVLSGPIARRLESVLTERETFTRLVRSV